MDMNVTVSLLRDTRKIRAVVATDSEFTSPINSDWVESQNQIARMVFPGLPPGDYFYTFEINGLRHTSVTRKFRVPDPANFTFAVGGDQNIAHFDNPIIYELMQAEDPDFLVQLGDLHYYNTNTTNINEHLSDYGIVLSQPRVNQFFREIPVVYMYDDHDFCGNNSHGGSVGRDAAVAAFRLRTPAQFASAGPTDAAYRYFDIGRVRFIVTDLRSERDAYNAEDGPSKTMMGTAQKAWFKDLLENSPGKFIIWVCTVGWSQGESGGDGWRFYEDEQVELANHIKTHCNGRIMNLEADVHSLGFDDGTNSDYATGGGLNFKVLKSAPLAANSHADAGPLSIGAFYNTGQNPMQQCALVEVTDGGGSTIDVEIHGYRVVSNALSELFDTSFSVSVS